MVGYALVDAFVAAAEEGNIGVVREAPGVTLTEAPAGGACEDHPVRGSALGEDGFYGMEKRSGFQDHAFAPTKGAVVYGLMAIVGPIAQIVYFDFDETGLGGSGDYAMLERAEEKLREDGDDMEGHGALI